MLGGLCASAVRINEVFQPERGSLRLKMRREAWRQDENGTFIWT